MFLLNIATKAEQICVYSTTEKRVTCFPTANLQIFGLYEEDAWVWNKINSTRIKLSGEQGAAG